MPKMQPVQVAAADTYDRMMSGKARLRVVLARHGK